METPLVSIMIITYNSSKYILETLDSAYNQTYKNIELVVTDDCSSDNTVELVRNWLKEHESRFASYKIVESKTNTGIPANCNRGVRACNGEWIRLIAGDDLLVNDGIERQVSFSNNNIDIIVSDIAFFHDANDINTPYYLLQHGKTYPWFFNRDANYQYRFLLYHYYMGLGISTLVRRNVYEHVTMFDENYPLEEDTLFQLNVTKRGIKYNYLECTVTLYRVHNSVSNNMSGLIMNKRYEETKRKIKKDKIYPEIPFYDFTYWANELIELMEFYIAIYLFHNKKNIITVSLFKILDKFRLLNLRNWIEYRYNKYIWLKKNRQYDSF